MGIIDMLSNVDQRSYSLADLDTAMDLVLAGGPSSSGIRVTETEAMKHAAVFSCVKVISEDVASLPWLVYRRMDERARKRATKHWLYSLLHRRPNPEMDAFIYKELVMAHLLVWGNHYTFLERDGLDRVKALWPLLPNLVEVVRGKGGGLVYKYHIVQPPKEYEPKYIWHIKGLGANGIVGYSPIRQMAESIGFGIAVNKFGATFFRQSGRLSGVIKHPNKLANKDVANRLIKSFERSYTGPNNAHKIALLEEGMEWQQLGVPPEDAQFLESRDFSRSEIAGIYRLAPHKIGDLSHATFSNIEEQNVDHWGGCIHPWVSRLEISADINLLGERERYNHFTEFLMDAKLRGKIEDRYRAYATARQWGWMSANDVRALENQNPVDGGDTYLVPMNMIPADGGGRPALPPSEGEPEEEPEQPEEVKEFRNEWLRLVEKRSTENREKVRKTFSRLFKDAAKRVVRKEVKVIRNLMKKTLEKGKKDEFSAGVKEFYGRFGAEIKEYLGPITIGYAEQIQGACVLEFEHEEKMDQRAFPVYCTCEGKEVDLDLLVEHYEKAEIHNHIARSSKTIEELVEKTPEKELPKKIGKMLDKWDEKRPDEIALREIVKLDGFVARATFFGMGAKRVKWVCAEGDTSLFSLSLNNKATTIDEPFLKTGDVLLPQGVEGKGMEIMHNVYHPPLYRGDESSIVKG